ncbi:ComEA family DNA-binding protein [Nocardiopsis tropica]
MAVPPAPVPPACGQPAPGGDGAARPDPRAAGPFGERPPGEAVPCRRSAVPDRHRTGADREEGARRRTVVRERYREEPAPGAGTRREDGSASHGPGPGRTSRGPAPRASDGPLRRTPDDSAGAPADRRSHDAVRDVPADREERGAGAPGPDPADRVPDPAGPWAEPDEERGRHRRGPRPPSGYTEFVPEPPGAFLERLARRWPPHATLSRRSVLALVAVGALAVTAVLVLHDRPATVRAPEMVAQAASAPAEGDPAGGNTGDPAGGDDPSGAVPPDGPAQADTDADLVVHVGGEVADPGLYTLPAGSRVADAVEEAGGALPDADLDLLNLARALVDGEQVLVGVPQPPGAAGAGTAGSGAAAGTEALVDVNRADSALLETLPGVGPVIARNIIEHREANGPFSSVDELLDVDRIGEKVLADLAPHATAG